MSDALAVKTVCNPSSPLHTNCLVFPGEKHLPNFLLAEPTRESWFYIFLFVSVTNFSEEIVIKSKTHCLEHCRMKRKGLYAELPP